MTKVFSVSSLEINSKKASGFITFKLFNNNLQSLGQEVWKSSTICEKRANLKHVIFQKKPNKIT